MTKTFDAIDVVEMTVENVQEAFANGTLTAETLCEAFLARIETYNPRYNAIIFMNPDALRDAREIDRRRAAGEPLGPLAGVPVVVKDTMDMKGFPTTGGWSLLYSKTGGIDLMPDTDSPVVARMRAAGCVILGKTNVPILSATGTHANNSWAGPTLNAAHAGLMPGGSSAGTATAVGTSMAVLGLAEETGGSIQNPASAQGLVGIKPTFALVPNTGVMPLAGSTRDVVGPIARCVRDAALALDVIAGYSPEDPKTVAAAGMRPAGGYSAHLREDALLGKRVGLYGPGWRNRALSPETMALYQRAQRELAARGAVVVDDPFAGSGFADLGEPAKGTDHFDPRGMECVPHDMEKYLERMGAGAGLKSWAAFSEATRHENAFGPGGVLEYITYLPDFQKSLSNPSAPPVTEAFYVLRERYLEIFTSVMRAKAIDVLIFPQLRDEVPSIDSEETLHETTVCEINIAGLPGVTVPAGHYNNGSPFNLIFVGHRWSEATLLAMAYDYECATRYRHAPDLQRE
ncbi:amidase [Robbsia andropogonis]|uniref:Amidase n=1 Tax=Robbsia andropogonis TaxID=28092 RepID=A0A0F5JZY7_9BURK|nr:amidase [Robbsia andropogonis]KKB63446.1 amidase [Robbsia andropogonis]MCP1120415.1 amidase [Robbsia andropogonis]MCP1130231.1 amidase [Robbsia andropogonis]